MSRKHVIVTGAGGGIGTQMVRDLIDRDYAVSAVDALPDALERLTDAVGGANGGELATFAADLTDSAAADRAVREAVAAHGTPYGLVNLAGNNRLKPLEEVSDEDWHFLIDVNLTSTFYMCRAVMPLMRETGGRVVNTSSIFGIRGASNDVGYAAAKAGVVGLTRALATEYAVHNVTVNCLAPVVVLTERVKRMPAEHLEAQRALIPLGRFSNPTDVTRTVTFLLGDDGGFYTGQTFSPNGGDTMP